jgi:hypothetical protein
VHQFQIKLLVGNARDGAVDWFAVSRNKGSGFWQKGSGRKQIWAVKAGAMQLLLEIGRKSQEQRKREER